MAVREILAGKAAIEVGLKDRIDAGMRGVSRKLKAFGGSLRTIGGSMAAMGAASTAAFGGILGALSFPTKLAADLELTTAKFETMLGSAESAKAMLGELKAFAASTPLQFPEISDAAQKLLAFGVAAGENPEALQKALRRAPFSHCLVSPAKLSLMRALVQRSAFEPLTTPEDIPC